MSERIKKQTKSAFLALALMLSACDYIDEDRRIREQCKDIGGVLVGDGAHASDLVCVKPLIPTEKN